MGIEQFKFGEQEKKTQKINEQEKKDSIKKKIDYGKDKKKLIEKIDSQKNLNYLKSLVDRSVVGIDMAKIIVEGKDMDTIEINNFLDKIDYIEDIENIDDILPKDLRITKDEYIQAIDNYDFRQKIVKKITKALTFIHGVVLGKNETFMNDVSGLLMLFNESLVKVQEGNIDIKRNLLSIDENKDKVKMKKTLFEKIVGLFYLN